MKALTLSCLLLTSALCCASAAPTPGPARSQGNDLLNVVSTHLDRPTVRVLGVQMLISGDDDRDAVVTTRVRPTGSTEWITAPPLFRVFPETVGGFDSRPQFAGSIFDLEPDTAYEIELHAVDPDGFDQVFTLDARTRPIPRAEPMQPRAVAAGTPQELSAALSAARPGDVITIGPGTYEGVWELNASGTAENPIVLRGASVEGVVLDGQDCDPCYVLTVDGSYVHVEDLTLTHGHQGLRFLEDGATGNVARRLRIHDIKTGIKTTFNQTDFYICDNTVEGRLEWPWVERDDWRTYWDDRGMDIKGDGHVVCHNRITGFGDPLIQFQKGARSFDFYGNDIDNGVDGSELDGSEGNARFFLNRVTNQIAGVSVQPIYGGPAYILRNVIHNVFWSPSRAGEQVKLHPGGGNMPSGVLVMHNTFISSGLAMNQQTTAIQYNFQFVNNIFVGPDFVQARATIDWTGTIRHGRFDYNGYYPDGPMILGRDGRRTLRARNFSGLQRQGFEEHGVLLRQPIFASGLVGPDDPRIAVVGADVRLAPDSAAIDRGLRLPGLNDRFVGDGPDLGALELGCPEPIYGPRPRDRQHIVARIDC